MIEEQGDRNEFPEGALPRRVSNGPLLHSAQGEHGDHRHRRRRNAAGDAEAAEIRDDKIAMALLKKIDRSRGEPHGDLPNEGRDAHESLQIEIEFPFTPLDSFNLLLAFLERAVLSLPSEPYAFLSFVE